jgi:hypothetical protein
MVVEKVINLPNYCNGKLYKRWDKVSKMFGGSAILASKTDKSGNYIELLITDGGKKRQLFDEFSEVIDEIDVNGIKRTYSYQKQNDGTTSGMMTVQSDLPEKKKPLIMFAKWISKELKPLVAEIKINPNHPKSNITITEKVRNSKVLRKYEQPVTGAKIEEFEPGALGVILPRKITFDIPNGATKVIDGGIEETRPYVNQLDLLSGQPNIQQHMRIIV